MSSTSKSAHRLIKFLFLLLILGPLLLELASDNLESFNVASTETWARFFQGAFWYQSVVKAGGRRPRDHYVRLVTLVRRREPNEVFDNACEQRLFMSKLLAKIEAAQPAVIVIDKYYSPYACPDANAEGNKKLRDVLSGTNIPIIIGLRTSDQEELDAQGLLNEQEKKTLHRGNLVLEPFLHFEGENVKYGLIRSDHDTRRIPLEWKVFDKREDLALDAQPHFLATVPQMAVQRFDPTTFSEPRLAALLRRNSHPFASFLTESEFPTFSAMELVCDPSLPQPADWKDCKAGNTGDNLLRSHVVVIGNRTIDDFRASVVGTVPGMVLQANYIEALLDDRYFQPVNFWVALAVNALLVALIALLFYKAVDPKNLSADAALAGSLLGILFVWVLVYVLALQFGFYLVIWFPGAVALIAMWAHGRAHDQHPEPAQNSTVTVKEADHATQKPPL